MATADILEDLRKATPLFQMALTSLPARTEVDFDRVFAQMSADRPDVGTYSRMRVSKLCESAGK